ncbi:MAG TPA: YceI family protein [Tepidisphaeraceae bacterium]
MRIRRFAAAVVLALSSLAAADNYTVDAIHSSILFKVKHADAANFYGAFEKCSGTVVTEGDVIKSVSITIDAASVQTRNEARDKHLRGPDFFDTKQFPEMTFVSKDVKASGEGYEVTGDLTMHGTTRPQTVTITKTGAGKNPRGKDVIGLESIFTIKRSDFGVSGYVGKGVGDEVTLIVSVECAKE